ncbi:MAG: phage protease [Meiothermus ruber]|uniref:phage protease n=1 Tax=Meiothermus sp. TaxID=1955249 RepID=UPI0025D366C4|nr:phage protease [Meiothermus sp.]MCS7069088.1 phage protease [Meiothermus sp.]MCX7802269.1 phage protease [Meiothermus ruber]
MPQPHKLTLELPQGPPGEFRIFPFGSIETTKGLFLFNPEAGQQVMAAWQEYGNRLSIDYEHQALDPVANGPVPAAGWFDLELREDGLWAVRVEWTQRARELLQAREYRYFSPAFYANEEGWIVELINLALTNIPATKRMEPLVAKDDWPKRRQEMTEVLRLLGLRDGQEAEVGPTLTRLVGLERTLTGLTGRQSSEEALAVVQAWQQAALELPRVQERLSQLEEAQRRERLAALLERGQREGKLTPAMLPWAQGQSLEALTAFLEVAPRVLPEPVMEPQDSPLEWGKLSHQQRKDLFEQNPELYRRLRKEALGY